MANEGLKEGLKDVVALRSGVSFVDGENCILEYRGYSIHDLAKYSTYEEVTFLLLYGYLPSKDELDKFVIELALRREIPPETVHLLQRLPRTTHPTVALRTAISHLGSLDKKLHEIIDPKENLRKGKDLVAKIPTIVAYYYRIRQGKYLVHPDEHHGHAENFLWMFYGEEPKPLETKVMDLDLILHAEHTLNASTFSARIAASTEADIYAGVVSATGVLFGRLHGGASQAVIEMVREIQENDLDIQEWVDEKLEIGEKIMGFGHRVYRCEDPRAEELKRIANKLDEIEGNTYVALCDEIAEAVWKRKKIYPNVDFYAAALYANLGIPDDFYINLFAMGRIAGWVAHIMEQYSDNKIIRPRQEYNGDRNKAYPTGDASE